LLSQAAGWGVMKRARVCLEQGQVLIHFDLWWNPAVEDQATACSHRIGQTKVVTSFNWR